MTPRLTIVQCAVESWVKVMNREELLGKYKAGDEIGEGYETEEWLLDDRPGTTGDNKIVLLAYDANMFPLPNFSTWQKKHRQKVTAYFLNKFSSESFEVWLDDVRIK